MSAPLPKLLVAPAVLAALLACGGGSSSSSSRTLVYTNPAASSSSFRLVRDSASTSSNLVLDLVGPSGSYAVSGAGVAFSFKLDSSRATWGTSPAVTNGNVFTLGSGTQLAQGWVTTSQGTSQLQGLVSQKGLASPVIDISVSTSSTSGILAQVRIQPVSDGLAGTVSLADGGLGSLLGDGGSILSFTVKVGTLTLQ